ncbi:hypothetical protein LX32DRAFT_417410 [Colletotrichum zoysiae]|uniref:Uncharacterized protein n=1 Tax=Colletotrichum zoysiae TaxID=1216348 RepID=A0AAD9M0Z2_9PEZI|nr:hypothetical protein LX32DRAFT_417410 [Colletotrichum zoysiae]
MDSETKSISTSDDGDAAIPMPQGVVDAHPLAPMRLPSLVGRLDPVLRKSLARAELPGGKRGVSFWGEMHRHRGREARAGSKSGCQTNICHVRATRKVRLKCRTHAARISTYPGSCPPRIPGMHQAGLCRETAAICQFSQPRTPFAAGARCSPRLSSDRSHIRNVLPSSRSNEPYWCTDLSSVFQFLFGVLPVVK